MRPTLLLVLTALSLLPSAGEASGISIACLFNDQCLCTAPDGFKEISNSSALSFSTLAKGLAAQLRSETSHRREPPPLPDFLQAPGVMLYNICVATRQGYLEEEDAKELVMSYLAPIPLPTSKPGRDRPASSSSFDLTCGSRPPDQDRASDSLFVIVNSGDHAVHVSATGTGDVTLPALTTEVPPRSQVRQNIVAQCRTGSGRGGIKPATGQFTLVFQSGSTQRSCKFSFECPGSVKTFEDNADLGFLEYVE